jgi:chromosome segregation protein
MDDVIFAGTSGRAPLGRAEVTLTIDNTDGALPIEYTEVSITRRLFRTGDGEYEINGNRCRLLDIQELLSDSGIGREMHVIVGQGQLDAVLHAKPEDRRAFIEEAAGVLKHRKRKEKALRKLDAMGANLNRVSDLTAELRRQLKPLGKQAEIARRAAGIQADLRDARLRLLADDLWSLRGSLRREVADEEAVRARRAAAETEHAQVTARLRQLEQELAADAPVLARAQETWYRLSALEERFRSTAQLASERLRFLSAEREDERTGRDPEALEAEAERIREQEAELREVLENAQVRLAESVEVRQQTEQALQRAEQALVAAVKAVADRREGLAKLTGQVNAMRTRAQAASDEIARVSGTLAEAHERLDTAQRELEAAEADAEGIDSGDADLDARLAAARDELATVEARAKELTDAERAAEREAASFKAREEALALSLTRKDAAGALLTAGDRLPGVLGSVAALLSVDPGHETAIAAALGPYADAVAVRGVSEAVSAVELLKTDDAGRATLVVGGDRSGGAGGGLVGSDDGRLALPVGTRWAMSAVRMPSDLRPAISFVLGDTVLVADLASARALVSELAPTLPTIRAVTSEGDVIGAGLAAGGSASQPSVIEVQAAVEEARERRAEAEQRAERLSAQLSAAQEDIAVRKESVQQVTQARREAEQRRHAVSRRLAELGAAARSARGEAERLEASRLRAEQARDSDLAGLAELEERLRLAEDTPLDDDPDSAERDELAASVGPARQNEMEARLSVRTAEERVRALAGRADGLARQAAQERAARERAAARRAARQRGAAVARAVTLGAQATLVRVGESLKASAAERDAIQQARVGREAELREVRGRAGELSSDLERLTDAMHRDEVARAEQRMRIESLEAKAAEDFGIDLDTLLGEYGPEQPVPPTAAEQADAEAAGRTAEPKPFDRPVQEKRAARAERELALLGKVNPLALEEFAALEERYKFLNEQLDDLKSTRKGLLDVVKEVDDRILEVFRSAYEDTAREFAIVFDVLFPGGEGRLTLTDPEDLLTTGIEVEARPPNKKIKRLSLLSGGERSLAAVALLCAIFRARPSPFYVMDEVEAALDDVNLGRLLNVMKLLQMESQLIVVTHQKRTMEIADALYGVTMRAGVTQVISQRLADKSDRPEQKQKPEPAAEAVAQPEPEPVAEVAGDGE